MEKYIIFVATQLIILAGATLNWYVQYIRLRDKVVEMERGCDECRKAINIKIDDQERDFDDDLLEIKKDLREMRHDLSDLKVSLTAQIAEIKTIISGKTVQL